MKNDNSHMDCDGQAGGCPECTNFNICEDARIERLVENFGETQDWRTKGGNEWSLNFAGGGAAPEIELNYEYRDGYHGGTSSGYLFLTRDDLVAMLAAVDGTEQ